MKFKRAKPKFPLPFLGFKTTLIFGGIILSLEVLFLAYAFVLVKQPAFFASILPRVLVELTNENRVKANAKVLTPNPALQKAAQMKAEDMTQKGYFDHESPDGITPWYWFRKAGYGFSYAGENLAVNFLDSQDVSDAWMRSGSHRDNILNNRFTEIGIGTAKGLYEGRETIFVVQFFGAPAEAGTRGAEPKVSPSQFVSGASFAIRIAAAPRSSFNYLFFSLAAAVALTAFLELLVRFRILRPAVLLNGAILLVLIASAFSLNYYLSLFQAKIF